MSMVLNVERTKSADKCGISTAKTTARYKIIKLLRE